MQSDSPAFGLELDNFRKRDGNNVGKYWDVYIRSFLSVPPCEYLPKSNSVYLAKYYISM